MSDRIPRNPDRSLPGLSPVATIAMLLPATFGLPPVSRSSCFRESTTGRNRPTQTAKRGRIMSHHEGEEILFILTGKIELLIGKRKEVLYPGDCVQFDSTIPPQAHCSLI